MESDKPQRIPLETAGTPTPAAGPLPPASDGLEAPPSPPGEPLDAAALEAVREQVIAALKTCYDPEVPVNIYELGLVYNIDVKPDGFVHIRMTLTSPACPVAGTLPPEVRNKVKAVPGVSDAQVEVVWDPPWHQGLMSDAARLELGLDY